jgi:hypothetical protein
VEEEGHRLASHVDAERKHEIAELRARIPDVVDGGHRGGDEAHDGDGPEGEVLPALLHRLALHVEEPVGQHVGREPGGEEAHHGGGGAEAERPQQRIAERLAGQRPVEEGPHVAGRGHATDRFHLGAHHESHDAPVGSRHPHEEQREEEEVVEEAAEEVAHRAEDLSGQEAVPHDDEVAVSAKVAELVGAVELPHGGLLGHVGVEGQGGRLGAEVRGLAGDEGIGVQSGAGLARRPALPVREQRGEARADIAAPRHRAEIVEAPENVEPGQRLQHAQVEGGGADAAARQGEPDVARVLGGDRRRGHPRQHPALREIAPLAREHPREVEHVGIHAPDAMGQAAQCPHDGDHRLREEDELQGAGDAAGHGEEGGRAIGLGEHAEDAEVLGHAEEGAAHREAEQDGGEGPPLVAEEPHEQKTGAGEEDDVGAEHPPVRAHRGVRLVDEPQRAPLAQHRLRGGLAERHREPPGARRARGGQP